MAAKSDRVLDTLESAVLQRIARHRVTRSPAAAFSIAALLGLTALASGVLTGMMAPHHPAAGSGSESALLADDVGLAPSSLLASN
jgi:hypothetical protein